MIRMDLEEVREMMNTEVRRADADAGTLGFLAGFLAARGKIGDTGTPRRPWMFFTCFDSEVVEVAQEAFWHTANVTRSERSDGQEFYRLYLYGPAALYALQDLLPYLRGQKRERAETILERWEGVECG